MTKPIAHICVGLLLASGLAARADTTGWYTFTPANDAGPSAIGMEDWLEKPAGKHGRITRVGDKLVYNGQPLKLWGLNLCYGTCAPEQALADKRAEFYPKFGINTVRLHKFADGSGWSGIQSKDSAAEYDTAGLERMDYQVAKFKQAGIYVNLSAHFRRHQGRPGGPARHPVHRGVRQVRWKEGPNRGAA